MLFYVFVTKQAQVTQEWPLQKRNYTVEVTGYVTFINCDCYKNRDDKRKRGVSKGKKKKEKEEDRKQ